MTFGNKPTIAFADALELGALRTAPLKLTEKQKQWINKVAPEKIPIKVTETILEYYLANRPTDTDWCVLPITNIEAFLGSTSLHRQYMKELTDTVFEKKDITRDISIIKILT